MATTHTCHVDCRLEVTPYTDGNGKPRERRAHIMYAAEPSSAAGRYQWEQNRAILDQGRRAWRASGQGQSRACRVWDEQRRTGANRVGERLFRRKLYDF
ncbi:hypothetical protein ISF9_060 [Microbacterium phage vB_MoxS-ISF9]|uniref:Uncharacterized protein n=1 Tax=Microbacterium phage vB_MoxS-ISF9 TaxID=1458670 RepID=W8NNL4_9CAUD|nr:hypothetical protein ISF9_060 [Microbacterium phage vB_MoxS-ISF9]AHL18530.1 hypothetical protein ISF9_060 [Microbacterium phage vB_MoxS-ISF9]